MAYEYSNNEYTEMVRVLAKSHDNAARACHEFVRLFPNLPTPSRELMLQATQRLRDHGQFQPSSSEMISEEEEEGQEEGIDDEEDYEEEEDDEENAVDVQEERKKEKEDLPNLSLKNEPTEPTVSLPTGKGFLLGHIRNVVISLSRFKTQDQKILHQFLYGQLCPDLNVTENIMKFKGFQWSINSTEYKSKLMETARMEPRLLRAMCEMLDLDKNGGATELATRLMGFLQQPKARYDEVSRSIKTDNRNYESDQEIKANSPKDGSEESDGSTKSSGSEASDSESECEVVIGSEEREAEAKVIPDRQNPPPKNMKRGSDMLVRTAKGEKASSEESYEGEEEGSCEEESGDESDTPVDKKAKCPPTDEEIKKYLKQILEGANLEQVTMKTVCKQVYSHYPDFDLEYKKDFIKATVKSLL